MAGEDDYYEIYLNNSNKLTVVSHRIFHNLWRENPHRLTNHKFSTEEATIEYLNINYKPEYISPDFLTPYNKEFFRVKTLDNFMREV